MGRHGPPSAPRGDEPCKHRVPTANGNCRGDCRTVSEGALESRNLNLETTTYSTDMRKTRYSLLGLQILTYKMRIIMTTY